MGGNRNRRSEKAELLRIRAEIKKLNLVRKHFSTELLWSTLEPTWPSDRRMSPTLHTPTAEFETSKPAAIGPSVCWAVFHFVLTPFRSRATSLVSQQSENSRLSPPLAGHHRHAPLRPSGEASSGVTGCFKKIAFEGKLVSISIPTCSTQLNFTRRWSVGVCRSVLCN